MTLQKIQIVIPDDFSKKALFRLNGKVLQDRESKFLKMKDVYE